MRYKSSDTKHTPIEAPLMMLGKVIYAIKKRVKVLNLWIEKHLNLEIRSL